jgi:hypothetical protein
MIRQGQRLVQIVHGIVIAGAQRRLVPVTRVSRLK